MELFAWLAAAPATTGVGWALFLIYRNAAERRVQKLAERGNVHMTIGLRRTEVVVWRDGQAPPTVRTDSRAEPRRRIPNRGRRRRRA